ncbi:MULTISPECIES: hypothetical protein [Metabacillus]|uniref:hypothetical protein n=1 Tax=Metabacillus TaxID=2675233 RepID=UPI000C80E3AB|nr:MULTISPECIES: hypothetical protein [Metabacillus]MCM3443594.1 hypothetical protein [Metabacillus halosaccharovorans]PMC34246.1 hypothetical protein CJ195_24320 [Bacillus sp. UMB0899]
MVQNLSSFSQEENQFDPLKITGFVVSSDFISALFDIEKNYHKDMRFSLLKNETHPRKLHHVLKSDLITTLSLHLTCNTVGIIREITLHRLYVERVSKISSLSFQEFLYSIEKLKLNDLITITENPYTKRINIAINYFINTRKSDEKPIPHRYITVNPTIIFSDEFQKLSISHWKVYFGLIWRAGSNKNYKHSVYFDRNVDLEKSLHMAGLKQFLLKQQNSDVRRVIQDLTTISIGAHGPLLKHTGNAPLIQSKFNRFHKANYMLNPKYHLHKLAKEKVRHPLEVKETYPRQARAIEEEMIKEGIGELASTELKGKYNGSLFRNLVYILKDQSRKMINHAVFQLKREWEETGKLPYDLESFVQKSIRYTREALYTKIMRQEGLYDYLIYGYKKGAQRDQRIYDFLNKMSKYSVREFRIMCKEGAEVLDRFFTEKGLGSGYRYCEDINYIPGIQLVREEASRLKVDIDAYEEFEEKIHGIVEKIENPLEYSAVSRMMHSKLEDLPKAKQIKPATHYGFRLEDFLVNQYKNLKFRIRNAWNPTNHTLIKSESPRLDIF